MARLPTLYVSHGSPNLALTPETPAYRFFSRVAAQLPRARAILVISAHYCTRRPAYATTERPPTIHDFSGFNERLYAFNYAAPGAPDVARDAAQLLVAAGFEADEDATRGYDHGVWVPLHLMYPDEAVPIAQVSMQPLEDARHHYRLGQALKPLRGEGVLIIASGSFTHNLRAIERGGLYHPPYPWVTRFVDWMYDRLIAGDRAQLLDAMNVAPNAADNHPYDDHLLPLFVAMGATDEDEPIVRLHTSYEYGVLSMDTYQFGRSRA